MKQTSDTGLVCCSRCQERGIHPLLLMSVVNKWRRFFAQWHPKLCVLSGPYDVTSATHWKVCVFGDTKLFKSHLKSPFCLQCPCGRRAVSIRSEKAGKLPKMKLPFTKKMSVFLANCLICPSWGTADVNELPGPQGEPSGRKLGDKKVK